MRKRLIPALTLWLIYVIGNLAIMYNHDGSHIRLTTLVFFYIINGLLIYSLGCCAFPVLLKQKKYYRGIAILLFAFIFYCALIYLNECVFEPWYYRNESPQQITIIRLVLAALPYYFTYFFFAIAFYLFRLQHEQKEALYKAKVQAMEAEKKSLALEAENNQLTVEYLRAQINPHFLGNTLMAIQYEIMSVSPSGVNQIGILGELMDYSLQEAGPDGKVPLKDEINAIENLLFLIKIRVKEKYAVSFEVEGIVKNQQIGIHLLLTLVENLVKYGFVEEVEHPATIKLLVNGNKLKMTLHNWNRNDKYAPSKGIGLKNFTRRLELLYPGNHNIEVQATTEIYQTTLTLNL
jgi:two-component system, LytTR family, sensor kinase